MFLKAKVDAGANPRHHPGVLRQRPLFSLPSTGFARAGIAISNRAPAIIADAHNFKQARNFVTRAGTTVPDWLAEKFERPRRRCGKRENWWRPPSAAGQVQKLAKQRRRYLSLLHHEPRGPRVRHPAICWGISPPWRHRKPPDPMTVPVSEKPNRTARGLPANASWCSTGGHGHHDPGLAI